MAVRAANAHYKIHEIRRRHWSVVAKDNALGNDFEATIKQFIERTPTVVNTAAAQLPDGFPDHVADSIFDGLQSQAKLLESQAEDLLKAAT